MAPRMKAIGLADPRVDICFDRGNRYYEADHPMMRQNTEVEPQDAGARIFRTIRRQLEANIVKKGNHYFIPRGCQREIFTPGRLLAAIQQLWKGMTEKDHRHLCDRVLYELWEQESGNDDLRLSDRCLPLISINSDGLIKCQNSNHSSHQFPGCEEDDLSHSDRHSFEQASYALSAVYFKLPTQGKKTHVHYCLGPKDVLPYTIIPSRTRDSILPDGSLVKHKPDTDQDDNLHGGFGEVRRIRIHRSHFNFDHLGSDAGLNEEVAFALKRLHASDKEAFDKELASLIAVKDQRGTHLIKLLTTFSVIEEDGGSEVFYLLFPWAEGNLWKYWEVHQPKNEQDRISLAPWMAQQCYQLARALLCVHNEREHTLQLYEVSTGKNELYGRHGDVKAENVLYFQADGALVLSDFGLGRLHTKYSRSNSNPKALEKSATYRAPEFDLVDGRISRASDVFSLGCMFLEFVTWYLMGYDAVYDAFPDYRMEEDPTYGFESDTFFKVEGDTATIKPKVREWMEMLRRHKKATAYTKQFLDTIEKTLSPHPKDRIPVGKLVRELDVIRETCARDPSYYGGEYTSRS